MRVLGALLVQGERLEAADEADLARQVEVLSRQCTAVCVVGCQTTIAHCIAPWPRGNAGGLGLLAGALRHARDMALQHVLSFPALQAPLPAGLLRQLVPAAAHVPEVPLAGLWRVADLLHADLLLAAGDGDDIPAFAALCGARRVAWKRQP